MGFLPKIGLNSTKQWTSNTCFATLDCNQFLFEDGRLPRAKLTCEEVSQELTKIISGRLKQKKPSKIGWLSQKVIALGFNLFP